MGARDGLDARGDSIGARSGRSRPLYLQQSPQLTVCPLCCSHWALRRLLAQPRRPTKENHTKTGDQDRKERCTRRSGSSLKRRKYSSRCSSHCARIRPLHRQDKTWVVWREGVECPQTEPCSASFLSLSLFASSSACLLWLVAPPLGLTRSQVMHHRAEELRRSPGELVL